MRGDSNERLTILTEAEKTALYNIPNFDDFQRVEFFAMTEAERSLALQRRGILKQVYCLLQIGYFKANQAFFQFSLDDVPPEDVTFLLQRYFPKKTLTVKSLSTKEYYAQRREIVALFDYRLWTDNNLPTLRDKAKLLARTDVTPTFLLPERPNRYCKVQWDAFFLGKDCQIQGAKFIRGCNTVANIKYGAN